MSLTIGALCAGYGGLDMAVGAVMGAHPAWFCEIDPGPSKILAHRYRGVPNHRDLTSTDWATVTPVDIITAGWPCQPWSAAGKQKGADDERAIWPAIARAVCDLRPQYVVLENVSAVVGLGELARVVGDLAAIGYDAQWQCIRASDVGAPHRRERIFILAQDAHRAARGQRGQSAPGQAQEGRAWADAGRRGGTPPPDTGGVQPERRRERGHVAGSTGSGEGYWGQWERHGDSAFGGRATPPDASCIGRTGIHDRTSGTQARIGRERFAFGSAGVQAFWGDYAPVVTRWEAVTGHRAPDPTEPTSRGGRRLSPAFVEWMMGLPPGWVTDVPDLSRNAQLKALGNGVVPQQASAAITGLLDVARAAA